MTFDKYKDIPYNFIIGPNQTIYEGRGWDVQPEAVDNSGTPIALDSLLIGLIIYPDAKDKEAQEIELVDGALELIKDGNVLGFIENDPIIITTTTTQAPEMKTDEADYSPDKALSSLRVCSLIIWLSVCFVLSFNYL